MRRLFALILICLCTAGPAWAWRFSGVVTDPDGEALPSANVYVSGTSYGTVTNLKGEYFLQLEDGEYDVQFGMIGFAPMTKHVVIKGKDVKLDVQLQYGESEIEEVEIRADKKDPAYAIMEEVVAHKKDFLDQFESWKSDVYLKVLLEVDSSLMKKKQQEIPDSLVAGTKTDSAKGLPKLNLIESYATTWYQAPGKWKSEVHAYRDLSDKTSGSSGVHVEFDDGGTPGTASGQMNNPYLFYLDVSDVEVNFYRNLIDAPGLGPKPFVSPASSSGKLYYRYRLDETFSEDGRIIYKIEVIPINEYGPVFKGYIWVIDGLWAIKSVNLELVPGNLYFFYYFRVIQDYMQTETGEWVLEREEYHYNVKEGKRRYYGNTFVRYSNFEVNPEIPRRFFGNELRRVDDEAFEKDSTFWEEIRPIALKEGELSYIHMVDSVTRHHNSPEYLAEKDSAYNHLSIWDVLVNGMGFRSRAKHREIYINSLLESVRPLGVGGYRQSIGGSFNQSFKRGYMLRVSGELDYGFKNKDIKGHGKVQYTYLPKRFARAFVKYGNVYSMVNSYESITATFSRSNYIQKRFYGFGHEFEVVNGLYLDVEAEYAERKSLEGIDLANWSEDLFGTLNVPAEFDPYEEVLLDVRVKFTPFQKFYSEPYTKVIVGSDWPTFTLHYKKAIPGLFGADIDYDFLELNIRDEFDIGTFGTSRYNVYAGQFLRGDSIQFTDYKFFRGSDRIFYSDPMKSFQLLGPTLSTRSSYLQAHYLHNFSGTLLSKVPLIRRTRAEVVAGASMLLVPDQNFIHGETYVGIQVPFRIRRQLIKIGGYYIASTSNSTNEGGFDNTFKIGINFFNSFNNTWQY